MTDAITKATICRFNPGVDDAPYYKTYEVPWHENMSILQMLRYIYEELEPISFEYSCRAASCGTCGVMVDGVPHLACITPAPQGDVTVEPLKGLRVIKDLVVDRTEIINRLNSTQPWFSRTEPMYEPLPMEPQDFIDVSNLQLCKDCMCCMTVCPQYQSLGAGGYAGPYIMVKLASRYFDTREDRAEDRLKTAVSLGLFNCIECGQCHEVCPRGKILETDGYPNASLNHVSFYQRMKADAEALGLTPTDEASIDPSAGKENISVIAEETVEGASLI